MFGDSDGSKDPGASALASDPAFPNSELTLSSNLCDKPTLASAAAAEATAPGSSSPPNPAADAADAAKRGDPPGDDSSVVGGKEPRLDSLQLSLSPPSDGPGQPSSHPQTQLPSASAADGDLRGASAGAAAAPPPSWTYSATTGRTRSINSDDMFSHNATDICAAGEGTNGSVHSRFNFCPMADGSVAFPTPPLKGGTSSFFPTELPAKMAAAAAAASAGGSFDGGRGRILRDVVSDSVSAMAHVLQDFPNESLEMLREAARSMVDALEKRDELASLQRTLERRSDLTAEALARANRTQLEILVAIKTGTAVFVTGKGRVPSSELVEMFLMTRCRNVNCKTMLPVDDCVCKICSSNKGFCGGCMCMVCHKFDCAPNTCSWVGCDVCGHWCHAACALERNLISPGPTLKGPIGTTEMQFLCLGCDHASGMFGFVKEVFSCCAENWNAETLMEELDLARKVFAASDDFEGKGLHAKAEEVLSMYAKRVISLLAATNIMLQFFKYSTKNKGGLQHTSLMPRKFSLQLLEHITYNFSKERIIGRGAYGVVYKGVMDGEEIAVKKLYSLPGLGDDQFNECINLMRVQHQNIVRLVGYCYETQHEVVEFDGKPVFSIMEERALCLEYLQGGSLDRYISDEPCGLDWSICYGIIKGMCEGLKYLHTGSKSPICHLDLKPGNILLDMDMIPKIGDFGLSRLIGSAETCVAQNTIGTLGYMPPEYIDKQEITPKFDVFSLGVIIAQIMAGRTGCFQRAYMPPQEFIELVHGKWERRLQATMSSDTSLQVNTCTEIALRCVEDDPVKRPTIAEIVDKLNKIHTTKSSSTLEE